MMEALEQRVLALPTADELTAERARRDLKQFARQAWNVLEPMEMRWNWHHDLFCEWLTLAKMRKVRRLIFNIPPQCTKSRLVTVFFPAWCWADQPHLRFMAASYSAKLSQQHSTDRRDLMESIWYQEMFPGKVQFSPDQNQKNAYQNLATGRMMATSTGASATGLSGDFIILDDLINPEEAESEADRKKALSFFDGTIRSRLRDQVSGVIIIVEQRTHEKDTSGHAMELEPGVWTQVRIPMVAAEREEIIFPISGRRIIRQPGDLLWEKRFPQSVVDSLRVGMHRNWSPQYQQAPTPPGGSIIKREWLHYWTIYEEKCRDPKYRMRPENDDFDAIIASWDMAFKDSKDSSFVSGQVWGSLGARRLLLDRKYGQWDFVRTRAETKRLSTNGSWGKLLRETLVEEKANGAAIVSDLQFVVPGLIPWPPKGSKMASKESRMYSVSPLFQAGNVEVPDPDMPGYEWAREYIENILRFPAKPNDDGDSTSQALERLKTIKGKEEFPGITI